MPFEATNEALIRRLADAFSACNVGGTVTYAALSEAIGGNDILKYRYLIAPAMKKANAETGAVFRNVRTVGFERLPNAEAHSKGQSARRRSRRLCLGSSKQIENAMRHANDMTPDAIRKNWSEVTHLGLLVHQSYDRNAPVIPLEPLPPNPSDVAARSLDAMRAALGRDK